MSDILVTVDRAAELLKLHPKTVIRYIRDGRLPAARIGKSYRIEQAKLDEFAGVVRGHVAAAGAMRTTCIVDIPNVTPESAERIAQLLHSAAMTGDGKTSPLHINTAFEPPAKCLKVIVIGSPSDVARLLEMLQLVAGSHS